MSASTPCGARLAGAFLTAFFSCGRALRAAGAARGMQRTLAGRTAVWRPCPKTSARRKKVGRQQRFRLRGRGWTGCLLGHFGVRGSARKIW